MQNPGNVVPFPEPDKDPAEKIDLAFHEYFIGLLPQNSERYVYALTSAQNLVRSGVPLAESMVSYAGLALHSVQTQNHEAWVRYRAWAVKSGIQAYALSGVEIDRELVKQVAPLIGGLAEIRQLLLPDPILLPAVAQRYEMSAAELSRRLRLARKAL